MMSEFKNKIDFAVLFTVKKANPNGDPLDGNRPRVDVDGYGEMSDVCIKRKIRNRLQDMGERVFVQSQERSDDGCNSLSARVDANKELAKHKKDKSGDKFAKIACESWIDVRSFGQVFAFKGSTLSVGVRGPVTVRTAVSVSPVDVSTMQITKSVNGGTSDRKGPDTMASKNRVEFGLYKFCGSINHQLAEKTGFSEEDLELFWNALKNMFDVDRSAARGLMSAQKLIVFKHDSILGNAPANKLFELVKVEKVCDGASRSFIDYSVTIDKENAPSNVTIEELI